MRVLAIATFSVLTFAASPAAACPDDQYNQCTSDIPALRVCACVPKGPSLPSMPAQLDPIKLILNPGGYINSAGIPTTGDFVEEAFRNPDRVIQLIGNPGMLPYLPIATGMVSSRNAIVARGKRIPPEIRQQLLPWYSAELMDSVRYTSDYGPILNTFQAWQMHFGDDTAAVTVMNGIVFHDEVDTHDPVLWSHELYHVQQYHDWGVFAFAREWTNNSTVNGPVEAPAYQREAEVKARLAVGGSSTPSYPAPGYPPFPGYPQAQGNVCMTQVNSCPWVGPVGISCMCASPWGLQNGSVH